MNGGEILATLTETIGPEKTRLLLTRRGGEEVYIPRPETLTPDHWLAVIVGFEAAMKIADVFRQERITLPWGPEGGSRQALQRAVRKSAAAGVSVNQIVRATGLHARTVRRIKARRPGRAGFSFRPPDPRQGRLFEDIYQTHDQED